MGWVKSASILFMLLCSSFAAILESGDSGVQFAADVSAAKCAEAGVQAVYLCSGNVVRVVSADGSAFYKPEGKIVRCANVAPSQMGAECMQMMTPNYCPVKADCGVSNATATFPGNTTNASTAQVRDLSSPSVPAVTPVKASAKPLAESKKTDIVIPAAAPSSFEFSMDSLAIVVLLLGAVSVGVLFTMFKNSISE
ncbi:MAG: hypothetical protein PHV13_02190 [Candidatus ainarchaeum sp.]|nr:hypothetical protein [Candidatus ainarchaeum sp.]